MDQPQEEFIEAQSSHSERDASEESRTRTIHVVAIVTATPGQRDEVLQLFNANRPSVLAEKGCIEYKAAIDADPAPQVQTPFGSDTFVVVEKWERMEALQAHFKAPHMAAYSEKTRDLVASE